MAQRGAVTIPCSDLAALVAAVRDERAVGAVHDLPLLRFALRDADPGLTIVGSPFTRADYGVTLPPQSPLRTSIDVSLLELRETDALRAIESRWLGGPMR